MPPLRHSLPICKEVAAVEFQEQRKKAWLPSLAGKVLQGLILLEGTSAFISRERKTLRKILARMKEAKPGRQDKLVPFASWSEQYQSRCDGQSIWSLFAN